MATRYNRDTISCTYAELMSMQANGLLDTRVEYYVTDRNVFYNASGPRTLAPSGGGATTQDPRTGSFNFAQSDSGSTIPITGAATATLLASANLGAFECELRRYDAAGTLTVVAGAGTTLWSGGASVANLTVSTKGGFIAIFPGSAPNEFFGVVKT